MTVRTVAILGAGHGGLAAAADLTLRGFDVRLHARNPARLEPIRQAGGITIRGIHDAFVPDISTTTDVAEAVNGADLVMLVVPSIAHAFYARKLSAILTPDLPVFLNPGHTCGGLHFVNELRRAGYRDDVQTCEAVTLTYICRLASAATVDVFAYTKRLAFAAFPGRNVEALHAILQPLFPELEPASSVLETALTNINAVFHPTGMILNTGWIEHTGGDFLFYKEGITEGVGRATAAVDAERMAVAAALMTPAVPFLDTFLRAGLTTPEAAGSGSIAQACRESEPNRTIRSPASLDHRYVTEDVGFGLVPFAALGRLAGVKTPVIDGLIALAGAATGTDFWAEGLTLDKMGLAGVSVADLPAFLREGRP
jgi:opine dehydrogenase